MIVREIPEAVVRLKWEKDMQLTKIDQLDYIAFLLEQIAWNTGMKYLDLPEYRKSLKDAYASHKSSPAEVLRHSGASPRKAQGEEAQHEPGENARVRKYPQDRTA